MLSLHVNHVHGSVVKMRSPVINIHFLIVTHHNSAISSTTTSNTHKDESFYFKGKQIMLAMSYVLTLRKRER